MAQCLMEVGIMDHARSVDRRDVMTTWKITLIATVIGTAVGFGAWALNLTRIVWPEHPQVAGFFLTVIATIAIQLVWPTDKSRQRPRRP